MHGAAATGKPAVAQPAVAPLKWDARVAVAGITLLLQYSPAEAPAVTNFAVKPSFSPSPRALDSQDISAYKAVPDELPPGPDAKAAHSDDDTDDEAYVDAIESLHSSAASRQSSGLGASATFASGCGSSASRAALSSFGSDSVLFHYAAAAADAAAAASAATTEDASKAATSRIVPEAIAAADAAADSSVALEHMSNQCKEPAGFVSRTAATSGLDGRAASLEGSSSSAGGDGHHGSSPAGCGRLEVECSDLLIDASGGGDRDHTVAVRIYAISTLEILPPGADTTR